MVEVVDIKINLVTSEKKSKMKCKCCWGWVQDLSLYPPRKTALSNRWVWGGHSLIGGLDSLIIGGKFGQITRWHRYTSKFGQKITFVRAFCTIYLEKCAKTPIFARFLHFFSPFAPSLCTIFLILGAFWVVFAHFYTLLCPQFVLYIWNLPQNHVFLRIFMPFLPHILYYISKFAPKITVFALFLGHFMLYFLLGVCFMLYFSCCACFHAIFRGWRLFLLYFGLFLMFCATFVAYFCV